MTSPKTVKTQAQIHKVAELARDIWTEHYLPIIGKKQLRYMLLKFQSASAIAAQIADGYEYYIIAGDDGESAGYSAILQETDGNGLMLSKLYVKKSQRGRGLGHRMLLFTEELCREREIGTLWLTVNKNNVKSIAWYKRMGFRQTAPIVQDIGEGFVMDDYRMEKLIR